VVDDNALVDREAAVQAGLGWYGKNANVLLPGRGSWFVLGSVVTDAQLPPSRPLADGCGPCVRCLHSCPTGAIVAPGVIDARRCLAWLLEAPGPFPRAYRELLGDRIYGCDDCQDSCPHNIRAPATDTTDRPPGARPWVDAVRLLSLDDAELMAAAGSWYVAERNPRYLRRNALVVLGNVGDGRSAEVVEALAAALHHDDPLVRGHAVWAAARVGRPELADGLDATERDTAVLNELAGRVAVTPNAGAALTSDGVVSDEAPGRTRR
jgi:epoxyqueuosine reductase